MHLSVDRFDVVNAIYWQAEEEASGEVDNILDKIGTEEVRQFNQSNFYSANIPYEARLSGVTAKSVFNSKIEETVP